MKKIGIIVCLALFLVASLCMGTQAVSYSSALPSENQSVYVEKHADDTYNLLVNSGFETVAEDGKPTGWTVSHDIYAEGAFFQTARGDAHEGDNFAILSGKEGGRIYLSQILTAFVPNETYAFSSYMRHIKGEGQLRLNIIFQKEVGSSHQTITTLRHPIAANTSWTKVSYSITVPSETTRIIFHIRMDGEAELHVDNTALLGKVKPHIALGTTFRESLYKEHEMRSKLEKPYTGEWNNSGISNNTLVNGNFNENNGNTFSGWGYNRTSAPFLKVAENASQDGSDALEISIPKGNGLKNPYCYQIIPLVGGAEYTVSFWYKNEGGGESALKFEFYTDRTLPGAEGYGGKHIKGAGTGVWKYTEEKIKVPENATEATILARLLQGTETEDARCYIDNITIRMSRPPAPLQFETSAVFFYSDETEGTFSTAVNLSYFPAFETAKVDFEILDGNNTVWQKTDISSVSGKTQVKFPLEELEKKEYPYIAKATLYDLNGNVAECKSKQIYVYDRPIFLGQDGVYMKNGKEPFYPLFAYKVNPDQYEKVKEAGINLVQMGAFSKPEQAVEALDAAQRAGIMGFIALYNAMLPAGNEANIETTISILSDPQVQNHPALFGYGVMDEVFLKLHNPELDMENSYRLIRSLDKNRPIMAMEAVGNYYKETGKYVDILCIDPYAAAGTQYVYTQTARAREGVNYKKPVYALLETYYTTHGRWPTPLDGRNNNWQALLAGANAIGYFNIREADVDASGEVLPIWNARDDGALWNALCSFEAKEKQFAYDHLVFDKTPLFCAREEEAYRYRGWVDGENVYILVLGKEEGRSTEVVIPLRSSAGDIRIKAYRASCIAGKETGVFYGEAQLTLSLYGTEALLYKITPEEKIDFGALYTSSFEDMTDAALSWQQATRMHRLGIFKGKSIWEFCPEEAVHDGEFKDALSRITGYSFSEKNNEEMTAEDAVYMAEKALKMQNAAVDLTVSLHSIRVESNATHSKILTRAEAAVLLDRVWYLSKHPEIEQVYWGFTGNEAKQICTALLDGENTGTTSNHVWQMVDGDFVYLYNTGNNAESIVVPESGQYAKILLGAENSTVLLREDSTEIMVEPLNLCVLRITDLPMAGLYIDNIAEAIPRENVTYTVRGKVAIYGNEDGVFELLRLYTEGETVSVTKGAWVRAFEWDTNLRPQE